MKQEGHLQVFDLILTTKSPLFIGCGKHYTKKEYLFDPRHKTVSFLDEQAMFTFLAEHNLAAAYESYILGNKGKYLRDFLLYDCRIPESMLRSWIRCQVDAGDALDDSHSLKKIERFVRNGQNQVYVPGSSVKGALRTVLLKAMLLKQPPANPAYDKLFEVPYFHTLDLKNKSGKPISRPHALNSILRGLLVSDSLPITDDKLCLTQKTDELIDGSHHFINLCRESIQPGVAIHCTITLDQSILQGKITKETLMQAIREVSEYHQKTVLDRYPQAVNAMNDQTILLGGGVGFQSKTVAEPYYGEQAMNMTIRVPTKTFKKHQHADDAMIGISPRALKQTIYNRDSYAYGVCEVAMQ